MEFDYNMEVPWDGIIQARKGICEGFNNWVNKNHIKEIKLKVENLKWNISLLNHTPGLASINFNKTLLQSEIDTYEDLLFHINKVWEISKQDLKDLWNNYWCEIDESNIPLTIISKQLQKSESELNSKDMIFLKRIRTIESALIFLWFDIVDVLILKNPVEDIEDFKDQLVEYQIKKWIIKDKNSPWAWNLWPYTIKNIKLSHRLKLLWKKNIQWEISEKLFDSEENEDFSLIDFLEGNWLPELNKKIFIDLLITKLKNNIAYSVVTIDWKKRNIKLSEKYIENNKDVIIKNFTTFTQFVLYIESKWKKYAKNTDYNWDEWSTAKWYFQFIDWFKWVEESTFTIKGKWSSWETALNYSNWYDNVKNKKSYLKSSISQYTTDFVNLLHKNKWKTSVLDTTTEQSLEIFIKNFIYKLKDIDKYSQLLIWMLSWNSYWMKELYHRVHHAGAKRPEREVKISLRKFSKKLIEIK